VSAWHLLVWVALPYAAIAIFIGGHIWRYRTDQYGWTTRSTQMLESRRLRWGSVLFHYGALAAIGGHVLGILIPSSWTEAFGISEHEYHLLAAAARTVAGVICAAGLAILVWRRMTVARVRVTTTRMDIVTYVLLAIVIGLGLVETIGRNTFGGGYDYRETVAVWPFTRLVHAWSIPLQYIGRPYILYRRRWSPVRRP
jgi:nitrate reductase gamma subunit